MRVSCSFQEALDLYENISSNYCMKEVKVTKNYRITIPYRVRKKITNEEVNETIKEAGNEVGSTNA